MVGPFGRRLPLCFDRVMVALIMLNFTSDSDSNNITTISPHLGLLQVRIRDE